MEISKFEKIETHILLLEGYHFPIFHKERRLYSFMSWKESREKLIEIMLKRIKLKTGQNTAYINFKMANPMRKTRLGNFFLDLKVDIKIKGRTLGTLEELGLKDISFDCFEILDPRESTLRAEKERLYSEIEYNNELNKRMIDLLAPHKYDKNNVVKSSQHLVERIKGLMKQDGWSTKLDNRSFARKKRCEHSNNI